MKRIFLSILVIGILLLSACGAPAGDETLPTPKPTEPHTYTLSISVSPSGAGSVSPTSGKYESGTQVILTAIPDEGWEFSSWSGDISDTSSTFTITMDSDKDITAYFSVVDIAPPIISGVEVSNITETSATITWITDEPATSQVEYGQSTSYGGITALDEKLVIHHSVKLNLPMPLATYHFRVISLDKTGNKAVSEDSAFRASTATTIMLPVTIDFKLTAIDNDDVSWTSGNITCADGTVFSVDSGSLNLANDDTYYLYYEVGNPELQNTQTFGNATGGNKALMAFLMKAPAANQKALIVPAEGS